ncbi:MAG: HNH endonuclease [Burkholderiaceae bacterium]
MNIQVLIDIFGNCWDEQTSIFGEQWDKSNPSMGQCAITSMVIQDYFKGDICFIKNIQGQSHYYNLINDEIIDLTRDQFSCEITYKKDAKSRHNLNSNKETFRRYTLLAERFKKFSGEKLSASQIEHVCIRNPSYVAGTDKNPEVKVFVQTHSRHKPIKEEKLNVGQTVWMKWVGGPIVAKSKILSWHCGRYSDGNINAVRELTKGSELIGLDDYWKAISKKKNGFYSVIRLSDEEWVENLIYSSEKSYGSSWIYLDNKLKKVQWLFSNNETVNKNSDKGRTLPSRLRWLVLRRDAFTCQDCGGKAPNVELHIDHIIPWSEVKEHKIENLRVLCKDCNLGKGTLSLSTQKSKLF